MKRIEFSNVSVGGEAGPLLLIAGPCVIENEAAIMRTAERLVTVSSKLGVPLVFKSSFDKANRSSVASYRGPGIEEGLRILSAVKKRFSIPVLSDVHCTEHVDAAAAVLDVLQIPAFLCRQTDLVLAAGRTGLPVNVKKGQFLAPWDMKNVIEKIESVGNRRIMITERGFTFGYNNLVSDMRAIPEMRAFGYPVIFDATHSVQAPGGLGGASGGRRSMVATLARAAVASGCDGVFLEVHENPDQALSDAPSMLPLDELAELLESLLAVRRAVSPYLTDEHASPTEDAC